MLETNQIFRENIKKNQELHRLSPEEVRNIQQVLLGIMIDFDVVCRENGLDYFLCGGTALGAVRHKGFIPWDDDVDILMPRASYDRLSHLVEKKFPGKYWVQNVASDEKYDLNFMKVRLRGTRFREILDSDPEKAGVFIDIFPLEDTFDNRILRNLQGIAGMGMLFITSCTRIYHKQELVRRFLMSGGSQKTIERKIRLGRCFSFLPQIRWLRLTEKIISNKRNPASRYVAVASGVKHYFGEMYHREMIFPARELEFEGRKFHGMNQVEQYLKHLYGDYMRIPPEEEREIHGVLEFSLK